MPTHRDSAFSAHKNTEHPTRDRIDAALFGSPRAALDVLTLELSAWRFLASHRVGGLAVTHVQFIDGDAGPTMNTPSHDSYYESVSAPTFGEAAIDLALALGMPCESERKSPDSATPSPGTPSEGAGSSSSAPTASRTSGARSRNSRRTRSRATGSTTGATSAEAPTVENRSGGAERDYLNSLRREALRSAAEWERAGYAAEADIRRTVAKWLGGIC